ncbi:MAG: 4-phosphoerythronate dehydrogenase [Alteromonadaceae bacterium]|nr:4-phosphoerythronate dehydrogenase [Alteromonadaceae bacterium]
MKIRYENSLPLAADYFSALGYAEGFDTGTLKPEDLIDVDVLAVRSTTRVNAELLSCANRLLLVATATAGINHLDTAYLERQGIRWMSAAGCNAQAVAEYVLSVLGNAHKLQITHLAEATIGIVGAGYVGSALAQLLEVLGIAYVLYDPPLQASGDPRNFVSWQHIEQCDVITLHVPFTQSGAHATEAMINEDVLNNLTAKQLLINACRGEVIDEPALKQRLQAGDAPAVVLDVFANEPDIDRELLDLLWLATPHIAGHSIEGKLLGTQLVYEAICDLTGVTPEKTLSDFLPERPNLHLDLELCRDQSDNLAPALTLALSVYDVTNDNNNFRQGMTGAETFSAMRKAYGIRREIAGHQVDGLAPVQPIIAAQLAQLGFHLK